MDRFQSKAAPAEASVFTNDSFAPGRVEYRLGNSRCRISLGCSFGHHVRTTGDPLHHPDGGAYSNHRNVEDVPKKIRTGQAVRGGRFRKEAVTEASVEELVGSGRKY